MNRRNFLHTGGVMLVSGLCLRPASAVARLFPLPAVSFAGDERLRELFDSARSAGWAKKTVPTLMGLIGRELEGIPYKAGTLDVEGEPEQCRPNLAGLDCVTFFDQVLAMARVIRAGTTTADSFVNELTAIRYRSGVLDGYASRLHYFSEWILDASARGMVADITQDLDGARTYEKEIDFMTEHANLYPPLKADPTLVPVIKAAEQRINAAHRHYIPKDYIGETEKNLATGDIIGFATSIGGLDVSHTGLCYRDAEGNARLLHASSANGEVTLDSTISEYCSRIEKQSGIIVARPLDPARVGTDAQSESE